MVSIGLVGCGFIGSQLAQEIQRRFQGKARLIGLYDADPAQAKKLSKKLKPPVPVLSASALLLRCRLLIEAASPRAAMEWIPRAVSSRKKVMVLSAGALLRRPDLLREARKKGVPVYVPSGALCGLDGIKAAAVQGLKSVILTTRKPPISFSGAPGVARKGIDLKSLRKPKVLFEGTAEKAVEDFPQNINVAATLALAGIGPNRTRVRIVADPGVRDNIHEIMAVGRFGKLTVRTENRPSAENPKTSFLAVQSAVAALSQILDPVKIGT